MCPGNCATQRPLLLLYLQTNRELKGQLDSYSDKFSDFQGTLTKSNEVQQGGAGGEGGHGEGCSALTRTLPSHQRSDGV